jgi:glycerate kinase
MGIRFLDGTGKELIVLPRDLEQLHSIDLSELDQRILKCEVVVLCDVDNMLLGDNGSAAIFGPQKGASANDVKQLDEVLAKLSAIGLTATGKDMSAIKYGGTAGGAAAGLFAFVNAKLENGIEYFLDLTGFDKALEKADLVVTGEGSIDEQTLQGKGPFGVANRAKKKNIPVIGLAGRIPLDYSTSLQKYFNVLLAIGNQPTDLVTALKATRNNLIRTANELGDLLFLNDFKKQ